MYPLRNPVSSAPACGNICRACCMISIEEKKMSAQTTANPPKRIQRYVLSKHLANLKVGFTSMYSLLHLRRCSWQFSTTLQQVRGTNSTTRQQNLRKQCRLREFCEAPTATGEPPGRQLHLKWMCVCVCVRVMFVWSNLLVWL